jgi:hypothetical protein
MTEISFTRHLKATKGLTIKVEEFWRSELSLYVTLRLSFWSTSSWAETKEEAKTGSKRIHSLFDSPSRGRHDMATFKIDASTPLRMTIWSVGAFEGWKVGIMEGWKAISKDDFIAIL